MSEIGIRNLGVFLGSDVRGLPVRDPSSGVSKPAPVNVSEAEGGWNINGLPVRGGRPAPAKTLGYLLRSTSASVNPWTRAMNATPQEMADLCRQVPDALPAAPAPDDIATVQAALNCTVSLNRINYQRVRWTPAGPEISDDGGATWTRA